MEFLVGGCRVFAAGEGEAVARGTWLERKVIGRAQGARELRAAVSEFAPGESPGVVNPDAEEVLYVVRGRGTSHLVGFRYALEPGVGLYVPPTAPYWVENRHGEAVVVVSVCCPEDAGRKVLAGARVPPRAGDGPPRRSVREAERTPIPVADRRFKWMVNEEVGCQRVTQFVGFIPPSKAPFHYHTYEEVIYILEGSGVVRVEGGSAGFGPGTCIYLPPGLRHCLENPGPGDVRLLGVFYPSGSPAVAYQS